MVLAAAIHTFWNQFMTAYEENSVPMDKERPSFPYMTYQLMTNTFENGIVNSSVTLWDNSENNVFLNQKVSEISNFIGKGGTLIHCDEGHIWINRGSPFSIFIADNVNYSVKGRQLNIQMEFFTS